MKKALETIVTGLAVALSIPLPIYEFFKEPVETEPKKNSLPKDWNYHKYLKEPYLKLVK